MEKHKEIKLTQKRKEMLRRELDARMKVRNRRMKERQKYIN